MVEYLIYYPGWSKEILTFYSESSHTHIQKGKIIMGNETEKYLNSGCCLNLISDMEA